MLITKASELEVKRKFGERVRDLRNKKGLSQEKLAFEVGMDLTSINEIERGHRSPKLITIFRLAQALGTRASQLLPF